MNAIANASIADRFRSWFTRHHLAQLGLIVQTIIIFRTSLEYFRLSAEGHSTPDILGPLLGSIGGVAVCAFVGLLLYFNRREGLLIGFVVLEIAGLVAFKLLFMPGLA